MFVGGESGHRFRTFGADGQNAKTVADEMRAETTPARLPQTLRGRILFALAVVALLAVFFLVG